jgi:hypothetical protein
MISGMLHAFRLAACHTHAHDGGDESGGIVE